MLIAKEIMKTKTKINQQAIQNELQVMPTPNENKMILDLCGGTGSWSKPFLDNGYTVKNITLPEYDLTDERTVEYCCSLNVYGILFATDCTVWANSGARCNTSQPLPCFTRWNKMHFTSFNRFNYRFCWQIKITPQ